VRFPHTSEKAGDSVPASACAIFTSSICEPRSARHGPTARLKPSGECCSRRFWIASASPALPTPKRRSPVFVDYYNYHRLSGTLGWLTPGERYDGTVFRDRGFENIPALAHLQDWLQEAMHAA